MVQRDLGKSHGVNPLILLHIFTVAWLSRQCFAAIPRPEVETFTKQRNGREINSRDLLTNVDGPGQRNRLFSSPPGESPASGIAGTDPVMVAV